MRMFVSCVSLTMEFRLIRSVAIFYIVAEAIVIGVGCNKQATSPPNLPSFPPLVDPIPFSELGSGKLVFERIGPVDNNYRGVYVVDIDHQRSWGIDSGFVVYDGPAVSPDGQKIAYTSNNPEGYNVFIMNIDGTGSQLVSDIDGIAESPSWTPDSKKIVFYSYLNAPSIPVYCQSPVPNPPDRTAIIDFYKLNPPYVYWPFDPVSISSNGKMVVLADYIWTFDSDGSNIRHFDQYFHSPSWSPDGNSLAGLLVTSDSRFNITSVSVVLFDSVGAEPKTLFSLSATGTLNFWEGVSNQYSLCWSPDGSKIAFIRPDGVEYGAHIYVINRDGTGLTQVTTAGGVTDMSLSWSR